MAGISGNVAVFCDLLLHCVFSHWDIAPQYLTLLYFESSIMKFNPLCSAGFTAGCRLQDCCSHDAVQYYS